MAVSVRNTASWMAHCRTARVDVSGDVYATIWNDVRGKREHEHYLRDVTPTEELMLSLRHRFFLDAMRRFVRRHGRCAIVNVGAGYSSYPFLLGEGAHFLEIDLPETIAYKKRKLSRRMRDGTLPRRDVSYLACDLSRKSGRARALAQIKKEISGKPSFILFEGILYYLPRAVEDDILNEIAGMQTADSVLALDTWRPSLKSTKAFRRLRSYGLKTLRFDFDSCTFHEPRRIAMRTGYVCSARCSYRDVAREIKTPFPRRTDIIWEDLTILTKKRTSGK